MRLYVSQHGIRDPQDLQNLERIVAFIVGVYYPCWFQIKVKHSYWTARASSTPTHRRA